MSDTLFKKVDYSMAKLMDDIEMGTIGLPDIQRPFVWKNAKVHKAKKAAVERHHLFPKKHLKSLGITQTRITNQIANYALVEWDDNIAISGESPEHYFPKYAERFKDSEFSKMLHWHALPVNWEKMEYDEFLEARRKLMAKVMREGFEHIAEGAQGKSLIEEDNVTATELIAMGETTRCEFKTTLRRNLHTDEKDKKMEHACLKTIAAFLNSHGGYLVIGVNDDGEALGLENDGFPNEDKMNLHLVNLLKQRLGTEHLVHVEPRFETYAEKRVLVVKCKPSNLPVYLKNGNVEQFYIRTGAATSDLKMGEVQAYLKQRF
ncbi:MAG: RNA-binding domain-containing protein [Novipirellula sp. JB048]